MMLLKFEKPDSDARVFYANSHSKPHNTHSQFNAWIKMLLLFGALTESF